jgi:hypothetical protein
MTNEADPNPRDSYSRKNTVDEYYIRRVSKVNDKSQKGPKPSFKGTYDGKS